MAEYIDRELAMKELELDAPEQVFYSCEDAIERIRYIPVADVVEVKHEREVELKVRPDLQKISDGIADKIGFERVLQQLAEECSELAQASLKLTRSIDGKNPTTKSYEECCNDWTEEIADVLVCMTVATLALESSPFEKIFKDKLRRWEERLNENG